MEKQNTNLMSTLWKSILFIFKFTLFCSLGMTVLSNYSMEGQNNSKQLLHRFHLHTCWIRWHKVANSSQNMVFVQSKAKSFQLQKLMKREILF